MLDQQKKIAAATQKILHYLCIHPEAADTSDGIAQWWLRRQGDEEPVEVVEEALMRLLQGGIVVQTATPNGTTIYRRGILTDPATRDWGKDRLH